MLAFILSRFTSSPDTELETQSPTDLPSSHAREDLHVQPRLSALRRWLNLTTPLSPPTCRALRTLMRHDSTIVRKPRPATCAMCMEPLVARDHSPHPQRSPWFSPDSFLVHMIALCCFGFLLFAASVVRYFRRVYRVFYQRRAFRARRDDLLYTMHHAPCYSAWYNAAAALDHLDGNHAWMNDARCANIESLCPRCDAYLNAPARIRTRTSDVHRVLGDLDAVFHAEMLSAKLRELADLYHQGDVRGLAFALRASLVRNFGGMCHPRLHSHSRVGTDLVLEDYVHVVSYLLAYVAQADVTRVERKEAASTDRLVQSINDSVPEADEFTLSFDDKLAFLNEARHAYGRTALMLSGGATMGLHHFGVVKSLLDEDLLPRVVCGTSAGALVASIVGILHDTELAALLSSDKIINPLTDEPFSFRFFHEKSSLRSRLKCFLRHGYLEDVTVLQDTLRYNYGDLTFEEAYNKTGRILNITVCPTRTSSDPPLLLNYLTAPHVLIWSAASASCAIPVLFAGVELVAKSASGRLVPYHPDGVRWMDGSINSDVPLARIGELFNVNHFIVSQTNPHVIPRSFPILQTKVAVLIKSELQFRYWQALHMGLVPRLLTAIFPHFMQPYAGDVTIMPDVRLCDLTKLFSNPTASLVKQFLKRGELQTYPYVDCVRLHCSIERALEKCVEHVARMPKTECRESTSSVATERGLFGRVPSWLWLDTRSILSGSRMGAMASRLKKVGNVDLVSGFSASTSEKAGEGKHDDMTGRVKETGRRPTSPGSTTTSGRLRMRNTAVERSLDIVRVDDSEDLSMNAYSEIDGLVDALEKDLTDRPTLTWIGDGNAGSSDMDWDSDSGEEERILC